MKALQQLKTNQASAKELKRLFLFFVVGGINTIFGYSLYALLLFLHFHYALASLLATVGGVLFNFKTTGIIVFQNHDNRLLYKFVGVYCITYSVNVGCLRIFAAYGTNMYLAGAVLVVPVALLSYSLLKKFVFGGEKGEVNQRSDSLL
jgi:GtrA-like protein.